MRYYKAGLVLITIAFLLAGCDKTQSRHLALLDGVNNVLMIGDSIRGGYAPFVKQNLASSNIKGFDMPYINNRNSYFTYTNLDTWFEFYKDQGPFQIITWNNGVWDSVTMGEHFPETDPVEWFGRTPAQYEETIQLIAKKLKATGARVIFFTTTVIPGGPFDQGKEKILNEIAIRVLPPLGVEVYDLNAVSLKLADYRKDGPWDVHYNDAGNIILADFVTKCILGLNIGELK